VSAPASAPDAERDQLRAALREVLRDACPATTVRAAWNGDDQTIRGLWQALGRVGVFGLLVPEQDGGLGGREPELVVVMEECGRFAVPGPVLEQVTIGVPALVESRDHRGEAALDGRLVLAVREPGTGYVRWGSEADVILDPTAGGWRVGDYGDGTGSTLKRLVDRSVSLLSVTQAGAEDDAEPPAAAALGVAAELLGVAARLLAMSVEYAKVRQQFGRPIGSQQAIKHHLATTWVAIEHARPVLFHAARAAANQEAAASRDVSFARVMASQAADQACRAALQVHGATGYAWEHDLHLWLKRAWVLNLMWGTTAWHRRRVEHWVCGPV
jgi:alkylation response protein AidB-like acyl-CoA dehydrogenase